MYEDKFRFVRKM